MSLISKKVPLVIPLRSLEFQTDLGPFQLSEKTKSLN